MQNIEIADVGIKINTIRATEVHCKANAGEKIK